MSYDVIPHLNTIPPPKFFINLDAMPPSWLTLQWRDLSITIGPTVAASLFRGHLTAATRRNVKMNEIERIDAIAAIQAKIQTLLTKVKPITDAIKSGQADARLLDKNNSLQKRIANLEDRKKQLEASV